MDKYKKMSRRDKIFIKGMKTSPVGTKYIKKGMKTSPIGTKYL